MAACADRAVCGGARQIRRGARPGELSDPASPHPDDLRMRVVAVPPLLRQPGPDLARIAVEDDLRDLGGVLDDRLLARLSCDRGGRVKAEKGAWSGADLLRSHDA